MRNKLFATAKGVINLSWCIAGLFLFVAVAANGTLSASTTPQIAGGNTYTIALKSDGTVWAWGQNDYGSLGDGTTTNRATHVQVSGFNVYSTSPTVTTGSATNVTSIAAALNGTANANGLSTTAWFNYGISSGSYTGTSTTQSLNGSSDTTVSISVSGLSSSITYYYRIAAQNSAGTSYGSEATFTTLNSTPVANAGNDQTVPEESTVTLDGAGSSDADGDALTYSWAFTTKPEDSDAVLTYPTSANPAFVPDEEGTYVVSLIVNDGTVNSSPDTVIVTVTDDDDGDDDDGDDGDDDDDDDGDEAPEVIDASVDIKPETINLGSKGKFKAYIALPSPYKEADIVTETVMCEGAQAIDGMVDGSGRYIATFNTQDLNVKAGSKEEKVEFTVTGELKDGTAFEGSDEVKVKSDKKDKDK